MKLELFRGMESRAPLKQGEGGEMKVTSEWKSCAPKAELGEVG